VSCDETQNLIHGSVDSEPSGTAVISTGSLSGERPWRNSVTWPLGVIRSMGWSSANQRLLSGPRAILPDETVRSALLGCRQWNSVSSERTVASGKCFGSPA
jgi:hypothetical protein